MNKLLFASVLLISTPALAGFDPTGCYAVKFEKKYLDRHPQQQVESVRLHIKKAKPPVSKFWNWTSKLDVVLRGRKDHITMLGNCDETRASYKGEKPGSIRCYTEPQPPNGGRVIFTPHGASSMLYLGTDPLVFGKQIVTLKKWDEQIQLEELDDWVCE